MSTEHKITTIAEAATLAKKARAEGKTVVTTNGAFDVLHEGHLFLLEEARKEGAVLIVGVNSDASVKRAKGPNRPIENERTRARHVAMHADSVFIFDDDDPRAWLKIVRPDVHVNAATYGENCIEAEVLKKIGAKLVLVPFKKELGSTTERLSKQSV